MLYLYNCFRITTFEETLSATQKVSVAPKKKEDNVIDQQQDKTQDTPFTSTPTEEQIPDNTQDAMDQDKTQDAMDQDKTQDAMDQDTTQDTPNTSTPMKTQTPKTPEKTPTPSTSATGQ